VQEAYGHIQLPLRCVMAKSVEDLIAEVGACGQRDLAGRADALRGRLHAAKGQGRKIGVGAAFDDRRVLDLLAGVIGDVVVQQVDGDALEAEHVGARRLAEAERRIGLGLLECREETFGPGDAFDGQELR
jgi:hypothetical protein